MAGRVKKIRRGSIKRSRFVKLGLTYFFLSIIGASMLIPFLWMVSTSLKRLEDTIGSGREIQLLPMTHYVVNDGVERRVAIKSKIPAMYDVKVTAGSREGQVFTNVSGLSLGRDFLLRRVLRRKERGAIRSYRIKILRKVSDKQAEVQLVEERRKIYDVKILEGDESYAPGEIIGGIPEEQVEDNLIRADVVTLEDKSGKPKKYRCKIVKEEEGKRATDIKTRINPDGKTILLKAENAVYPLKQIKNRLDPQWGNYTRAWKTISMGRLYMNSIVVAVAVTLGQVITSAFAAYAFSRLSFPGRDKIFLGYLATMMIPGAVTMIPIYILLDKMPKILNILFHTQFWTHEMLLPFAAIKIGAPIGIDSYFALIAPGLFSAYGTFLLRQFFMGLPVELEEAAKIDGCSLLGIFFKITLPLSKPAMATLAIFTFMGSWRSFMWPLIVINSEYMRTIPVGLKIFQGQFRTDMTLMMAGTMIALLPVIIAFLMGQRYFVEGIRLGAVKG